MSATTKLTDREQALLDYCLAGVFERELALTACRDTLGRALCTQPLERAHVAVALAEGGYDGIGRVVRATDELDKEAMVDTDLPDYVAGR